MAKITTDTNITCQWCGSYSERSYMKVKKTLTDEGRVAVCIFCRSDPKVVRDIVDSLNDIWDIPNELLAFAEAVTTDATTMPWDRPPRKPRS